MTGVPEQGLRDAIDLLLGALCITHSCRGPTGADRAAGNFYNGDCPMCVTQDSIRRALTALERPRPARPKPDVPTARELREYSDGLQDGRQLGREEASVGIPRRIQRLTWCDAERQIQDAVDEVERMGADVRLTDAVCLLGAARDRVADFVDGVEGKRIVPGVPSTLPVAGTTCPTCKGPAIETRVPDKELEYWSTWRAALPAEHAPPAFVGVDQKPDGCWFACIASLTGIPLGEFPEPPHGEVEASVVRNTVTKLLHAHGWQMHRVWTIPGAVPRGWAIAGGTSLRNAAHAVVVYDGELVWDPHPSRAGLVAIEEYEIVVPVRAGNALPVGSRPALAGSPDQLAELAKDFFASWQNPPPNSVHAVTEFIDYMRGRVSGTQEGTQP